MPMKRDLNSYFSDINAAVAEQQPKERKFKSWKIENLFQPTMKDGKFSVVIRFLPSHPDEIKPFVENRKHTIKLPNDKWFITECLTKFGKPCPICQHNREMYKKYSKEEAAQYSLGKGKSRYICNILVVRNANNTDTEGKVYRFEFGPQIMKMISTATTDREDELQGLVKGFNPFDWETGANFVYTGVQGSNGPKLDDSHFGTPGPIDKWNGKSYTPLTTKEVDEIESQLYRLDECYNKEEDVADFNTICKRWFDKTGEQLLSNAPAAESGVSIASTNPFSESLDSTKPAVQKTVSAPAPAADDFDFDAEPAKPSKKSTNVASVPEVSDEEFFNSVDEESMDA